LQYRANRPATRQIASDLGVDYLVEGSVRIAAGRVRMTVQLVDADQDVQLWTQSYDRRLSADSLIDMESEIARQVAFAVGVTVTPEQRDAVGLALTDNTDAYLYYLRGREAFVSERQRGLTRGDYESIGFCRRSIQLDPGFAPADALLALSLTYTEEGNDKELEEARQSAERALAILPDLAEARVALGRFFARSSQAREAMGQFEMAEATDPSLALAVRELGRIQREVGEFDEAVRTFKRAERIAPQDALVQRDLVFSEIFAHRYDEALRADARRQALDPGVSNELLAWIYIMDGKLEKARDAISAILKADPAYAVAILPGYSSTVLLRLLTAEQRTISLNAYLRTRPEPCDVLVGNCLRKAIHEEDVGSPERARIYWDSLRVVIAARPPQSWNGHAAAVLIYQGLGDKEAALHAAEDLVRLNGANREGGEDRFWAAPNASVLQARVLAHFGEEDAAIDLLEDLLPPPSWLSVPMLRIDPIWDPLRRNPRFQALLRKHDEAAERSVP
jgi:tetratricopeptide (TPR) repeat protein